jgi:uncharacterized protein with von Willebrand factor type A (vWA) domain
MAEDSGILGKLLPSSEHQVVHSDSMDAKMFTDLRGQSESLKNVVKEGTDALKTFPPLAQDIWSSLFKFGPEFRTPEEMTPSHRFNATLMDKMTQMQQYKELRVHTRLDDLHSAMATVALAEGITKSLKEELKEQADLANSADLIQKELERLANAAQTWKDAAAKTGNPDFQKQAEECKKAAELHKAQLKAVGDKLEQSCVANVNKIRTGVRAAAESALKNAQSVSEGMDGWGLEAGQLQKMPIEQKLELAKRLQTKKFKLMTQVIGRMRRLAIHKQKTKLNQARDEIHDISLGSDLSRVLPAELALLNHPVAKMEFRRKFVEGKLMQYELRGTEKQGKGPIVVCVDNSGSMAGDRETWSKAVALALLEIASMQKRGFACIHFGSSSDPLKVIEIEPGDKDILAKAVWVAEYFLNASGTAFEPALARVTELISKQSFQKADMVFITDGNAPIDSKFLADFLEQKKKREYRAFGVLIQSSFDGTLKTFCDEIVEVAELLDAEAEPLLEI